MTLPGKMMTAWRISDFGGPDVLEKTPVEVPRPEGDQVLLRVAYCGVCRHDLLTRAGAFPNVSRPLTLGHQVSGTVVAAGPDATWQVGDRLMSLIFMGCGRCEACGSGNQAVCRQRHAEFMGDDFDGGYADYICTPSRAFMQIPDGVSLEVAAMVNCTLGTAYHAVHARGAVRAGETVVVTGASGGIGLHTLAVLRAAGANIVAVTSRESQVELLRHHGADLAIADPELGFARRVKDATHGVGADLVIEVVGSATLRQSLHCVRAGGRVVIVGNVDGQPAQVRPAHLVLKEISLLGTKSCSEQELREVLQLVVDGTLSVEIEQVLPLDAVRQVHADMEAQATQGRTLLEVGGKEGRAV